MLRKLLKQHYGIDAMESTPIGHHQSCKDEQQRYLLIPVQQKDEEVILELEKIAQHLKMTETEILVLF